MMTPIIEKFRSETFRNRWEHILHTDRPQFSPILAEQENFRLKLAETPAEVEAAQRLRYRVFKQEQGRLTNCDSGIDADGFDRYCRHLIVIEKCSHRVVGTYRILSGKAAGRAGSFYSEGEFSIHGMDQLRREVYEVGRSCVDPEYRSGAVVSLLWSGLAALRNRPRDRSLFLRYAGRRRPTAPAYQYLFGCVSLEESSPAYAWALYEYLKQNGYLTDELSAVPRHGYQLARPPQAEIDRILAEHGKGMIRTLPPLFKGYLNLGAKICGTPALDSDFGTIDFLILMDMRKMPPRYAKHFQQNAQ